VEIIILENKEKKVINKVFFYRRAVGVFPVSPPPVLDAAVVLFSRAVVGAKSLYLFCSCRAFRSKFLTCSSARCFNSSRVNGLSSSSPLSSLSSGSRRSSL
jgi:hypothetical protein